MVLLLEIYPTDILTHVPKDSCTRWLIVWTGTDRKRPKCPTVRLTQVHTAIKQMRSQLQSLQEPSGNVGGWGRGSSTHPSPFYPHAKAHKRRYPEEALCLRHSGSTSQHPVIRCESVSMLLLAVVRIFSAWKTNHNANNTATAVFSSSWRSWRHNRRMQAPENSKWYCSRQHTPKGYTPSPKREDSRAVLFL